MRFDVEERHYTDGHVEVLLKRDDGETIATLEVRQVPPAGSSKYDVFEVVAATRVRGEGSVCERRRSVACLPGRS